MGKGAITMNRIIGLMLILFATMANAQLEEENNHRADVHSYDKNKEFVYKDIENVESIVGVKFIISQLFAGKYSAPFYGVVSILVAFILFCLSKTNQKSKPIYSCSREYVYAMKDKDDEHLEILWNKEPVENVRAVELSFWNNGKKAIRKADISKDLPITIECKNKNVKILSHSISANRNDINLITKKLGNNKIQIVLSNDEAFEKNDGFRIIITHTSENSTENDWTIDGRIFNSHEISNIGNNSVLRRLGKTLRHTLIYGGGGGILGYIFGSSYLFWIIFGSIMIILNGAIYFISQRKKEYRKPKWD
jgi:hypothetical protein